MVEKPSLLFLYISGMFEIKIIETGYIMADGGAMFGAVPKRAWKRKYSSNDENLCPLAMRCALAVSNDRKILLDVGMGDKNLDTVSYYLPHDIVSVPDNLAILGLNAEDITDVVLSHLHFDHCGGATIMDRGKIIPTFPNAKYWLSKAQWNSFLHPNRLEADSFFADNIQPIYDAGLLYLIEDDVAIAEGFNLRLYDGHTSGQLVSFIETESGVFTFPGDLVPTSAHVSLEWISAYDLCALTSLNEKIRFLTEAEKEGYTLMYYHDAKSQKSKVKKLNDNFKALL